jgi:hypothetical protein
MPLTIAQLAPQVGTAFTANTQAGPIPLTLVEAVERPRAGLPPRFATPLSLLLRAPEGVLLAQASYELEHPVLGKQLWMIVPIANTEGGAPDYEVILSQLNDTP